MVDFVDPFDSPSDSSINLEREFVDPFDPAPKEEEEPSLDVKTSMYDNFGTYEEALDYYNSLVEKDEQGNLKDPNVEQVGGFTPTAENMIGLMTRIGPKPDFQPRYVYTDPNTKERQALNVPEKKLFGLSEGARVSPTQVLAGGGAESVGGALEFGAAISDKTLGTNLLEPISEKTFGIDTSGSLVDSIIADGGPAIFAGMGVGGAAYKGLTNIPKLVNLKDTGKIANFIGVMTRGILATKAGEAAATATVSTDEEAFLFGKGHMFGDVINLGETEADELIEQRINVFTEGLFLGGVFAGTLKAGARGAKLGTDMLFGAWGKWISGGSAQRGLEKEVYLELSRELGNLPLNATEDEIRLVRQRVAEIIGENKDILIRDINDLQKGMPQTVDTVSALLKGMDNKLDRANAEGIRAGAMNVKANSPIKPALDAPVEAVREGLETQRKALTTGMWGNVPEGQVLDTAADSIVDTARTTVDNAAGGVMAARQEFENSVDSLVNDISDDLPEINKVLRLEEVTGTDVVRPKSEAFDDIRGSLERGVAEMTDQKNLRYAQISGGEIDVPNIIALFEALPIERISGASNKFVKADPVRSMKELIAPRKVTELDMDGNTVSRFEEDDEVLARVTAELQQQGVDFGFFYKNIRGELSSLARDAYKNGAGNLGSKYRDVIKFIDEDMVKFIEDSQPELAEAATEAKRYFKEVFAPIWRDGVKMREFAELYDSTIGRTTDMSKIVNQTEPFRGQFNQTSQNIVRGALEGGNYDEVLDIAQALKGAGDPSRIADYYILDTINSFATDIRTQGMDGVDFSGFSQRLMRYAEQLNKLAETSPEMAEKVASINTFITRLQSAGGNQKELERLVSTADAAAKTVLEEVQRSVVAKFLNKELTPNLKNLLNKSKVITTSNPYAAFESIFKSKESKQNIADLMRMIDEHPSEAERVAIRKGLRLSYNKFLDNAMLGRKVETGGVRPINAAVADKAEEGITNLLEIGDQIYADSPELMSALRTNLAAASDAAKSSRAQPIASQSATGYNLSAQTATNRLLYLTIGPLNKKATRFRAVSSGVLERLNADGRAAEIQQKLLADPDYFLSLARKYNKNPADPLLEDQLYRYITSGLVKTDDDQEDRGGALGAAKDFVRDASEATLTVGSEAVN